jgi:hypothetical protein
MTSVRIAVADNGQMAIFIDEGTVEEAMQLSRTLYAEFGEMLAGVELTVAPPEQHRHGPGYEHQHVHVGNHTHSHSH